MERHVIDGKEMVLLTAEEYDKLTDGPKDVFEAYKEAKEFIRAYDALKDQILDVWPWRKEKEVLNSVQRVS